MIALTVPGKFEFRDIATRVVSTACKLARSSGPNGPVPLIDEFTHQAVSAVGEVFNNVAQHGYANREVGNISLEISVNEDHLTIEVKDFGHSFHPDDAPDLPYMNTRDDTGNVDTGNVDTGIDNTGIDDIGTGGVGNDGVLANDFAANHFAANDSATNDPGNGFADDFGDLPESGMGLFIVRSFVDELTYTPGTRGNPNCMRMVKRFQSFESTPPCRAAVNHVNDTNSTRAAE